MRGNYLMVVYIILVALREVPAWLDTFRFCTTEALNTTTTAFQRPDTVQLQIWYLNIELQRKFEVNYHLFE